MNLFKYIWNGDWGLGIGDWGLGPIPNPQSPIPNPQHLYIIYLLKQINMYLFKYFDKFNYMKVNNSK